MHEIRQMECKIYIFSTQAAHCKQVKALWNSSNGYTVSLTTSISCKTKDF